MKQDSKMAKSKVTVAPDSTVTAVEPEETPVAATNETQIPEQTVEVGGETPAVEQAPAVQPPGFLDRLRDMGFSDLPEDESEARDRLIEAYATQSQQRQREQEEFERLRTLAAYGSQYLEQKAKEPPPEQTSPQQPTAWWNPPQFDRARLSRYQIQDPTSGEWKWKSDTPETIVAQADAYQAYVADWADKLLYDPEKALKPAIAGILSNNDDLRQVLEPIVSSIFQQFSSKQREQTFLSQVQEENKDWLFEKDPRTQQVTERLTPEGEAVAGFLREAAQIGIADPQARWNYATMAYRDALVRAEDTNGGRRAAATEQRTQRQADHLARAQKKPGVGLQSRGGSVPRRESGESGRQNENLSLGEELIRNMQEEGTL